MDSGIVVATGKEVQSWNWQWSLQSISKENLSENTMIAAAMVDQYMSKYGKVKKANLQK